MNVAGVTPSVSRIRSIPGWTGLKIGTREFTLGYQKTTGIGVSYRRTINNLTLAKDFHTVNGTLKYHYHFIQPGKFTRGHLNPQILKQHGFRFYDLRQGLPDIRYKKNTLWRALEAAKY